MTLVLDDEKFVYVRAAYKKIMVDYLYYKLYKVALKSSLKEIPQILTVSWLGALLGLNILMLNALLAKTLSVHWFFKNHRTAGWFALILIIMLLLYFSKDAQVSLKSFQMKAIAKG